MIARYFNQFVMFHNDEQPNTPLYAHVTVSAKKDRKTGYAINPVNNKKVLVSKFNRGSDWIEVTNQ